MSRVLDCINLWDKGNRVTSVDEAYYSRNLKGCTDKLVYIPYFVLGEPKMDYDDPEKAEEVMEAGLPEKCPPCFWCRD